MCSKDGPAMRIHDQVLEFMKRVPSQDTPDGPSVPDTETMILRSTLIAEEFKEYSEAVSALVVAKTPDQELAAWADIADALADLHYVVAGAGIAFGLPMNEIADTVHQANMAKFAEGSWVRDDGKQMKPPDWKAPDHVPAIKRALQTGTTKEE